jgi:ribonuclease P protein component
MLPPQNRLRLTRDHQVVARRGIRGGGRLVVVQLLTDGVTDRRSPRVGFVVGRTVGGAVTRNAVRRRLRHLLWARLERIPAGSLVLVRAKADAGTAQTTALANDLDAALDRALLASGPGGGRR